MFFGCKFSFLSSNSRYIWKAFPPQLPKAPGQSMPFCFRCWPNTGNLLPGFIWRAAGTVHYFTACASAFIGLQVEPPSMAVSFHEQDGEPFTTLTLSPCVIENNFEPKDNVNKCFPFIDKEVTVLRHPLMLLTNMILFWVLRGNRVMWDWGYWMESPTQVNMGRSLSLGGRSCFQWGLETGSRMWASRDGPSHPCCSQHTAGFFLRLTCLLCIWKHIWLSWGRVIFTQYLFGNPERGL